MRSPRRRPLIALVLAAAVVLAACGDDGQEVRNGVIGPSAGQVPPDGPGIVLNAGTPGRRVSMVGDSITVGSSAGLADAATELGIDLDINAEVGRRMVVGSDPDSGVDAIEELLDDAGVPDLWVVALGTNDIGQYDEAGYEQAINEVLALIPPDSPLIWIDVLVPARQEQSELFNDVLLRTLSDRGNVTIGKWSDVAGNDGVLSDGIHPSDDIGVPEFVDVVSGEIEGWLAQQQ